LENQIELERRTSSAETALAISEDRAATYQTELNACVETSVTLEGTVSRQRLLIERLSNNLDALDVEKAYFQSVANLSPRMIGDLKRLAARVPDAETGA